MEEEMTDPRKAADHVDLEAAEECPVCHEPLGLLEMPAGYHHCTACWSTWRGPLTDATIADYRGSETEADA